MKKKKPVHLISHTGLITPCGLSVDFSVLKTSRLTSNVTCKKCKTTAWFKDTRKGQLVGNKKKVQRMKDLIEIARARGMT